MGDKPPFLGLDKAGIVRSIVLAFRFAQGIQSDLKVGLHIMVVGINVYSSVSCFTEPTGEGRFLHIVLLANSIHPTYTTPPTSASLRSASGRRGYGGANWLA